MIVYSRSTMRLSKAGLFGEREAGLAAFAGALSHPARIAIVTRLMEEGGELCCREIVAALPLAQATVSQHLKVLEKAGLVAARAEGVSVRYRLIRERLRSFCHAFQETLGTREESS